MLFAAMASVSCQVFFDLDMDPPVSIYVVPKLNFYLRSIMGKLLEHIKNPWCVPLKYISQFFKALKNNVANLEYHQKSKIILGLKQTF